MWGQIVTTKIKVLKKFLRLQCYQKPFKNSFSSTSSNFDNNGWWGKLDWKLPDIVTINKSFPAPSSRLSHIWCETSLWSLDKSTELLQVHIVSVNVMSIVQFIGSIANLCIGPRWNGPHLVVGKGQRIHNCLYSVFHVYTVYLPMKSSLERWSLSHTVMSSSWPWSSYRYNSNCSCHLGFRLSYTVLVLYRSFANL